ncbi:aldehyde dehydrogenase [Zobellella aerophila]|uniref:Aldehyde dehydrogenase n=1 Tax=Zobellella aerophila TaxID=870480 RepID=A0ABP6WDH0_9GAMM
MSEAITQQQCQNMLANLELPTRAFINGKYVDALSGKTFTTLNPATGKPLAQIASCAAEDIDSAVQAGRSAFEAGVWSKMAPADRKKVMCRWADLIEDNLMELAIIESIESGKPVGECYAVDLPETVNAIRFHAEAADKLFDQVTPTGRDTLSLVTREPAGVVGVVLPWNFPALMAGWKLGPALITGNSVIAKPAKLTSMSTLFMAELAHQAGLPAGVLNVVPGSGASAGGAIGLHPDIDVVAFTGSTEVGRMFLEYSARSNLKEVLLECGGKNPQIVMPDIADLDAVAEQIVASAFWNMGENCSAGSRLLVHSSIKERLLEKMLQRLDQWKTGNPLDPENQLGALIDEGHMNKVLSYIDKAKQEGCRLVAGGGRLFPESGGYFVAPTIFDNVTNDQTIAQEEIFGPVLAVITFDTEDEAVQIANDTCYGLAASLYSNDLNVAHRVSAAIRAGTVSVNCFSEGDMTTPFGGYKLSGFGGRDKSVFAHDQYCQLKTTWIQLK